MTRKLQEIQPQILVGLEGGYDMRALGECCEAVADVLVNYPRLRVEKQV